VQSKGFSTVLQELSLKTAGNIGNLEELGIKAKGLNAAVALTAEGGANFARILDRIQNSAGDTSKAYDKMVEQIGNATKILRNAITDAAIQFGEPLVAAFVRAEEATSKFFNAVQDGVTGGAFKELQKFIVDTLDEITHGIEKLTANLPEALKGLDFKPLIDQLEIAKEHFAHLFDEIDLQTPEGLHAALQKLINLGGDLVAFHNGVVTAFTTIFEPIFKVGELVAGQGQGWATLAGEIGGTAIAITLAAPLLYAIKSSIELLGFAAKLTSGSVGLINAAIAAGPVGLGLLAVALAGGATAFGIYELNAHAASNATEELRATHDRFINTSTPLVAALQEQVVGLGKIVDPSGKVIDNFAAISGLTGALIGGFQQTTGAIGQTTEIVGGLVDGWEALRGHTASVNLAMVDYAQSTGLAKDGTIHLSEEVRNLRIIELEALGKTANEPADLVDAGFRRMTNVFGDATKEIGTTEVAFHSLSHAASQAKDDLGFMAAKLSTVAAEALKTQQETNKFDLEWEKILSQDRQVVFKLSADIQLAQIQAGTEQIKAAFESVNTTVKSTGDTIAALVHDLANVGTAGGAGQEIVHLLEEENRRREKGLELQQKLVDAQLEYLHAVVDRLSNGEAFISVTADGLEPELEAFMFKILERIQVRASSEAQQFLLGLQ
jgi:hypothetical protein